MTQAVNCFKMNWRPSSIFITIFTFLITSSQSRHQPYYYYYQNQNVKDGAGTDQKSQQTRHPLDKPNIIVFLADDMGYGDLASYGHPSQEPGPIDTLAHEGVRFTRWYSADSFCSPSRAAIMTGRLPVRVGVYGPQNGERVFLVRQTEGLPKQEITIAEALRDSGYATGMVGKWHLGINEFNHTDGNHLPIHHGFDYVGTNLPWTNHWMCDESKIHMKHPNPLLCFLYYNTTLIQQPYSHHNLTWSFTYDAKSFISEHSHHPFFLYYSFAHMHTDMFAAPEFQHSSRRGRYGDNMNEMGAAVGDIINLLKELNIEKNTLVLFLSDHGPHIELCTEGGSAGVLRGGKGTNWEGALRVPAIAWWPEVIKPGQINANVISSMDLFATAIDLAGGHIPKDRIIDGRSFKSLLLHQQQLPERTLFHYCSNRLMAVTYGSYRIHFHTHLQLSPESYAHICANNGTPKFTFYHCAFCVGECITSHNPPMIFNLDVDPGELYPLDTQELDWLLASVNRIVSVHRTNMKSGTPLLHTTSKYLQPCCNPPYCMCNYIRQE